MTARWVDGFTFPVLGSAAHQHACERCHGCGRVDGDGGPHPGGADVCPDCGGFGGFCAREYCDPQAYSIIEFRASYGPDRVAVCDECGGVL